MDNNEKQAIHKLFELEQFSELYQTQADVINEMLAIESQQEFEDFLAEAGGLDEDVFWLHYGAVHSESLSIGGYEEDVSQKVSDFLKLRLPENLFSAVLEHLQDVYVDLDDEDNLKEKVDLCNQCLEGTDYSLRLDFDDTYYAGIYFLSVSSPQEGKPI